MWGPLAAALGVTQALLAIIILEDVNYIEHYGLQRALTKAGRRVTVICMCYVNLRRWRICKACTSVSWWEFT